MTIGFDVQVDLLGTPTVTLTVSDWADVDRLLALLQTSATPRDWVSVPYRIRRQLPDPPAGRSAARPSRTVRPGGAR